MQPKESKTEFIFKSMEITPPNPVGGYRLGKDKNYTLYINLIYKPNWLHRQCMRIFLGWYWEDKTK